MDEDPAWTLRWLLRTQRVRQTRGMRVPVPETIPGLLTAAIELPNDASLTLPISEKFVRRCDAGALRLMFIVLPFRRLPMTTMSSKGAA